MYGMKSPNAIEARIKRIPDRIDHLYGLK